MKKLVIIVLFLIALAIPAIAAVSYTPPCNDNQWERANWKTLTPPTCSDYGVEEARCPKCWKHWQRPVARLDPSQHDYKSATCYAPKTCKLCGATEGSPVNHNYSVATCKTLSTCSYCKGTIGDFASHKFNLESTLCTQTPVCSVCKIQYSGHGRKHLFSAATCTETAVCKLCGELKRGEHNWVVSGNRRVCSYCGVGQILRNPETPLTE